MSTSLSLSRLVGALVGACGYVAAPLPAANAGVPIEAVADIRQARVELYCGHDAQMQVDLRAACRQLRELPGPPARNAVIALGEAAWLARHGEFLGAAQALDRALVHLGTAGTETSAAPSDRTA